MAGSPRAWILCTWVAKILQHRDIITTIPCRKRVSAGEDALTGDKKGGAKNKGKVYAVPTTQRASGAGQADSRQEGRWCAEAAGVAGQASAGAGCPGQGGCKGRCV